MMCPAVRATSCCLVVAISVASLAALANAQPGPVVRGRVTLADGATRAAGVIVVAEGTGGTQARTLSNQRGEYFITLPAPGRYAVRVLRVGFRPTEGPAVDVAAGDTATANIQLTDVAVSLRAVTVREDDVCRTSPDSGALVARAWEEARKAIMASQLTSGDAPLVAEWIEYQRTLDATGRIVRAQRVRSTRSATTHAFRSAPAAMLAERGYVTLDGDETTFHAPDGDVLLSDSFAATHCFQVVQPARGADTLVGVGFRPARDRRDVRDISGTFWLDRRTAELRWLDYRYLNLPAAAERATPGGRVEFLHLGTGGWLIGRWHIRMPELARASTSTDPGVRRTIRAPAGGMLRAIQLTGGEVERVSRSDSTMFEARGATLDVQLVPQDSIATLSGAKVELDGTDYLSAVDARGHARISPVLEGRYLMRVRTALMDSLGIRSITREIEIARAGRTETVRLQGAEELYRIVCGDSAFAGTAMLRGSVRDPDGRPIAHAAVVIAWQKDFKIVAADKTSDRLGWTEETLGAFSDDDGRWRICSVPRVRALVARVKTDEGSDAQRVRIDSSAAMKSVDLVPHKVAATADVLLPRANRALVEFSVTDDTGAAVGGVTLEATLPGATGTRTLVTGPAGLALLPDVAPGRLVVRARKIGYLAGQVSASVAAGRNTVPIVLSGAEPPTLETVRIIGDQRRAGSRLDEFETRRLNKAATFFVTRDEIVKRNPVDAWQMLQHAPGMRITEIDGRAVATSTRVQIISLGNPGKVCYMRVMIDGILLPESERNATGVPMTDLSQLPRPDEIHGMEVFAGPSSIPLQYGGTGSGKWCGLIAIWRR